MRRTWNKLRTVFNNQNKSVQRAGRNSNKKTYNAEHRTLEKLGLNNIVPGCVNVGSFVCLAHFTVDSRVQL